jgi:hypothetical protein
MRDDVVGDGGRRHPALRTTPAVVGLRGARRSVAAPWVASQVEFRGVLPALGLVEPTIVWLFSQGCTSMTVRRAGLPLVAAEHVTVLLLH